LCKASDGAGKHRSHQHQSSDEAGEAIHLENLQKFPNIVKRVLGKKSFQVLLVEGCCAGEKLHLRVVASPTQSIFAFQTRSL
jgi:hypothetical protein